MVHRASGQVNRLFVDRENCYIRLRDVDLTKDSYFSLKVDHPNYNALYSLALSAAINGYTLTVRTFGEFEDVPAGEYPRINYLVVDW